MLLVPRVGCGSCEQAGKHSRLTAGESFVILSPGLPAVVELAAAYRGDVVSIPTPLVLSTWAEIVGNAEPTGLWFEPQVESRRGPGAAVLRQLDTLMAEREHADGVLEVPLVTQRLSEAFVASVVGKLPHDYSLIQHAVPPQVPLYVLRVEDFLKTNFANPVSPAQLAAVAGVGIRSVQAGFKAYRNYTPSEFLRARRYEVARQALLSGQVETIAGLALKCGFEHLSRFSTGYRTRFGESPRETMKQTGHVGRERDSTPPSTRATR
jgi:AraC-like DNA-binding protein